MYNKDPKPVWVGLGSNLGNSAKSVCEAMSLLAASSCFVARRSSLWSSAPIGYVDQPNFINAAMLVWTSLSTAEAFLDYLFQIEITFGRVRGIKNGPRLLDLDILLWNNQVITSGRVLSPHPYLHERAFVLYPLLELEPNLIFPTLGSLSNYIGNVANQNCTQCACSDDTACVLSELLQTTTDLA